MSLRLFAMVVLWLSTLLSSSLVWGQPNEISYEIQAAIDPQKKIVAGSERIEFLNRSDQTLDRLYLYLYPNRLDEHSVQAYTMGLQDFDRYFPHGPDWGFLHVTSAKVNGAETSYTVDDILMRIDLEEALRPGEALTLELEFILKIPRSIERLGYRDTNYYLSWWYPQLAVFDEAGWHTDRMIGAGPAEPYQDFARYHVALTVPQEFIVGATGHLEEEKMNPDGTKTLVYTAENVHDFAWVADPRYQSEILDCDGVRVVSLYWPDDPTAGKRIAQYSCDALRYFGERFGPYPYKQFTVAEVGMFGGAMEYPQLVMNTYFLYELEELPLPLTLLDVVNAHEIAHQWFFGILANDQVNETWLDEGFATFAMDAYAEHRYGKESLFALSGVPEWLHGPIKSLLSGLFGGQTSWRARDREAYATVAREGREAPLLTHPAEVPPGKISLPYQKGAMLLFALENLLGTETFDRVMKEYVERHRFQHVHTQDFIAVAEEISGQKLDGFFDQWLHTTETLDYVLERVVAEQREGQRVYRVIVRNDGRLNMPVDVELELGDGEKLRARWENHERYGTLLFAADEALGGARIDPEGVLPDLSPKNNTLRGPVDVQPFFEHGLLYGRPEDGPIVGARFSLADLDLSAKLGYLPKIGRFTYRLRFLQPFRFLDQRTSRFSARLEDDGRVLSAGVELRLSWFSVPAPTAQATHRLGVQLYSAERYGVTEEPGRVRGLKLSYQLSGEDRRGWWGKLSLEQSLSLVRSDYEFAKFSVEAQLHRRIAWQTQLGVRLLWGKKEGREPLDADFTLREHGLLRTFERRAERLLALNLNVRFPLAGLNFLELPPVPLPLSVGGIIFADGVLMENSTEVRAEAGIGLTFGPYGQRDLVRLELPLWLSTEEDDGRRGVWVRVDTQF